MTKLKAKLIYATPLWVPEYAGRQSHNSLDKFNHDSPNENSNWIVKTGNQQLKKFGDFYFELAMPRTILLEFEKHIIKVCSPNDVPACINRSTRYTLKELLRLIEKYFENKGSKKILDTMQDFQTLQDFVASNVRDPELSEEYTRALIKKYETGCTTPDTIKEALPESWLTTGVWKISFLAMENIIKQRHQGTTGKPHFLIQELVGLMINCLSENHKKILGVEDAKI